MMIKYLNDKFNNIWQMSNETSVVNYHILIVLQTENAIEIREGTGQHNYNNCNFINNNRVVFLFTN